MIALVVPDTPEQQSFRYRIATVLRLGFEERDFYKSAWAIIAVLPARDAYALDSLNYSSRSEAHVYVNLYDARGNAVDSAVYFTRYVPGMKRVDENDLGGWLLSELDIRFDEQTWRWDSYYRTVVFKPENLVGIR
jgi:hypothetical protein